jgi:hypothetical protein
VSGKVDGNLMGVPSETERRKEEDGKKKRCRIIIQKRGKGRQRNERI